MLCRNIRRFKFFIKMEILLNLSLSTFLCPVKKIDFLTQFFFDRNHFNFTLVMQKKSQQYFGQKSYSPPKIFEPVHL